MFVLQILSKIIGHINQKIAAIGIISGVAVAFTNVVARYLFDASLVWATELTIFLFLWSAFFGAAYCFKKDVHIAVTILLDIMPSKIAKAMLIISHIVTIIFLAAVAYYGYQYIMQVVVDLDERSIDLWNMPMWIVYLVIPLAFGFSAFRVLEKLIVIIKTPHNEVVKESEADMILHGMGGEIEDKAEDVEQMVKEANRKTGGML